MKARFREFVASHIKTGNLVLKLPDGDSLSFGDDTGTPVVARITDKAAMHRIAVNPQLALGEAFMDGTFVIEEGSIYDFLDTAFRNTGIDNLKGLPKLMRKASGLQSKLTGYNSAVKSKSNVAHHYDMSGELYRLFLDSDSQYSCAYFETADDSLEEAQLAKKRHLAAKMVMAPGQRVLDIGSGWGGMGLYLAQHADADVTGVTLSEKQHSVSNDRARATGLQDRVRFDLKDYRAVTEKFDRIISVGMFEHVGPASFDEFFGKVSDLLTDDGVMMLHYIGNTKTPSATSAWILKYIFPGGHIPSLSEVLPVIERHGLMVTDIEVLRLHYAETLRHWRQTFMSRRDEAVALYDERFALMWEFYLAASEATFRHQGQVVHQIQIAKRQEAVPLTRTYIEVAEERLRAREKLTQPAVVTVPSGAKRAFA